MNPTETLIAAIEAERIAEAAYSAAWGHYCGGDTRMPIATVAKAATELTEARIATDAALREALGVTNV